MEITDADTTENRITLDVPAGWKTDGQLLKHNVHDSVFTNLFRHEEYVRQLYHALHPEVDAAEQETISVITLENIFINQLYNDLGFIVGDRLMIFVEAQTTWTVNILVRILLYAGQTIKKQIIDRKQSVYGLRPIKIMKPEFYVIYTGDHEGKPETISLKNEFFNGEDIDLDITVHMIYDGKQGDIISQYVAFSKVYREQIRLYGCNKHAIQETIRICEDRDVLKAYLESHKEEVIDIMTTLFDYETILENYIYSETEELRERADNERVRADNEKIRADNERVRANNEKVRADKVEIEKSLFNALMQRLSADKRYDDVGKAAGSEEYSHQLMKEYGLIPT